LEKLKTWLDANILVVPPKSTLGKAMKYLLKQYAVRPFVMGRKSWLFAASVAGANASANLYSLVETAKANGHEPYAYLLTVFTKLPAAKTLEDIEALLPFNLKPGTENAAFDRN